MALPLQAPHYGVRAPRTNAWHITDLRRSPQPPYAALCGATIRATPGDLATAVESPRCPDCVTAYRATLGRPVGA